MMKIILIILIPMIYRELYRILGSIQFTTWENRFLNQLNSTGVKARWIDHLHRKIKFTSGLVFIFPNLNTYNLLFISGCLLALCFYMVMTLTHLLLPSIGLSILLAWFPFFILDYFVQRRNQLISKEMVKFISVMTRWSYVKDDIYYCFEKMLLHLSNPLNSIIEQFILTAKYSGDLAYAFDLLLLHSDNELYRNFIINIKQAEYSKGDLCALLERLEEEAYHIAGEHTRRTQETYMDRLLIYMTIVFVLVVGILVLTMNTTMRQFYFHTKSGNYLLSVYTLLFVMGIYVTSKITNFNY